MTSFEKLFQPAEVPEDEKELRAWLKSCHDILKGRTPDEIAMLARMAGFDPMLVYSILSHFRDAMDGSNINSRAALQDFLFESSVEDFRKRRDDMEKKETYLGDAWKTLHQYQAGEAA